MGERGAPLLNEGHDTSQTAANPVATAKAEAALKNCGCAFEQPQACAYASMYSPRGRPRCIGGRLGFAPRWTGGRAGTTPVGGRPPPPGAARALPGARRDPQEPAKVAPVDVVVVFVVVSSGLTVRTERSSRSASAISASMSASISSTLIDGAAPARRCPRRARRPRRVDSSEGTGRRSGSGHLPPPLRHRRRRVVVIIIVLDLSISSTSALPRRRGARACERWPRHSAPPAARDGQLVSHRSLGARSAGQDTHHLG